MSDENPSGHYVLNAETGVFGLDIPADKPLKASANSGWSTTSPLPVAQVPEQETP